MATILYKDGASQAFEAEVVQARLAMGWSVCPDERGVVDADIDGSGKLNPGEIRAAAQRAGIEDYATARIRTLKEKLGYE